MNDLLQPVGKFWRIVCCIASGIAAVMLLVGATILWGDMLRQGKFTIDGKPLWLGAIILTGVGLAAAFIALRLAKETGATTTLPVRFIEGFGVLFLIALGAVAYDKRDWLLGIRAVPIGVAMILVGRNIAQRRKKKPALPPPPTR